MLKKEIKAIIKNPVYFIIMCLPQLLTFIMSEGTKNYLSQHIQSIMKVNTAKEVIMYNGVLLNSKVQFAVSELNFMLMMCAILAGLSIFEERKLHVWNRVVDKGNFIIIKFITHYVFLLILIGFNVLGFYILFNISFSTESLYIFITVPIMSIILGLFVGLLAANRAMLSNTILMIVMLTGYFGGALSLTSVLSNTKFMNVLMYSSPLTMANRLIFKNLVHINWGNDLWIWILMIFVFVVIFVSLIGRRVKNGASI